MSVEREKRLKDKRNVENGFIWKIRLQEILFFFFMFINTIKLFYNYNFYILSQYDLHA